MEEPVVISGVVLNENNLPLKADIALTSHKGDTILVSKSDAAGKYKFNANLRKSTNYVLNFYCDSSFIFAKSIIIKEKDSLLQIQTVLPKLKKGLKYPIGNINFHGGSSEYITAAIPSLHNLKRVMLKNKTLVIKIIGHTNGCADGVDKLSKLRSARIKRFLMEHGIEDKRIQTDGKGCKEMLFPKPFTLDQMEQNRRVEVMVLEY